MTDIKFFILRFLYRSPNHENYLTEIYKQNFGDYRDIKIAIDDMLNCKPQIIVKCLGKDAVRLTSFGNDTFESENEQRQYQANQDAQNNAKQISDSANIESQRKKQFRHDFFIVIITAIVTLITENIPKLINALISLFK